jgi:hypothetical protein
MTTNRPSHLLFAACLLVFLTEELTVGSPEYEQKRATIEDLQKRAEADEIDLYYEDEVYLSLL